MDFENDMTIEFLEKNFDIVKYLYDTIKIVDPQNKKILIYKDNKLIESKIICYEELAKEDACEYCISGKAIKYDSAYMKIDIIKDRVWLITAVPLNLGHRKVAVEFVKDVTNSMFYGDNAYGEKYKLNNVINDLKNMSYKDELTEVYNRKYINEKLPQDVESCIGKHKPISIILTDIDYFKKVNDNFGHIYGDHILRQFSQRLKSSIRGEKDWIARYGGEEFLICIPNADKDVAFKIAERMRKAVKKEEMVVGDKKMKITASFGIYTIYEDSKSIEEFIAAADKNLYLAKNLGRNKIII